MEPKELRVLKQHMEWADALIWKAVLGTPALQKDRNIRDRLHHFHCTQWAYLQIWRGEPIQLPEFSSFADLRSLGNWARGFYRELLAYTETLREDLLNGIVEFPWAGRLAEPFGTINPATLAESILQLVLPTTPHRG